MNFRKSRWSVVILLAWSILPAMRAQAWIDTGHKMVAMIVWDDLTPTSRAKLVAILKQHPQYQRDLLPDLPAGTSDADTTKYAFAMAATWPDIVKSQGNPMHALYSHPSWHYIDMPYAVGGQVVPAPRPSRDTGPQNAVEALTKNSNDLKNAAVSGPDKAVALCWILHLGGDIHQPLHAISLYSPQFPDGDQGGNSFIVLRDPPYTDTQMNLHLVWDELPGTFKSMDAIGYVVSGLKNDPKYSREQLKDALAVKDFAAWAQESHELAIKYAYLDGKLVGNSKRTQPDLDAPIPGLPPGYVNQAEQVAYKRVILAGYRTADLLNSIFDPHQ